MKFYSSKSYKNGKYIFTLYKKSELFIVLAVSIAAFFVLLDTSKWHMTIKPTILIVALTFLITAPIPEYHSVYQFLFYLLKSLIKNFRIYISKGVRYVFEEKEE